MSTTPAATPKTRPVTCRRPATSTVTVRPMFEPFEYQFFVRGLLAATLVGGLCGMIGVYIVLKRMAYIGHGLSHAVLGGAVVSFVMSINFLVGATIWGFFCAQLITLTSKKQKIAADAAIGVITTASFALGIALISRYKNFTRDFEAALFGNILGVSGGDLLAILVVTLATIFVLFVAYKHFLFATFDGDVAKFYGVPTGWVETLFSLVLAGTIVVSMQVLGVLLIAGATVIPPIVARMLSDRFQTVILLSTTLGAACGFVGIYASYFIDVSSGACVVLVEAAVFALVMAYTNLRPRRIPRPVQSVQAAGGAHPAPGETD
ncbi:MAG TPA: metal ABC transporter permease [Dehalococcoidia bacterium]|nr:metal ABC transporter permease [Dehalococcoidia bacterium]